MPLQLWVSIAQLAIFSGLIGLGYLLVLRGAGVFMFALGPVAMISAVVMSHLVVERGYPTFVAFLTGVASAVLVSVLIEVALVYPLHLRTGGAELPGVVAIVAVLFALQQAVGTAFGRAPLPGQELVSWPAQRVGGVVIESYAVLLVVVGLILVVAAGWWMRANKYGRMLRAVGDNERSAEIIGVPVRRVRMIAFGIAGGLAGVAGPLFAVRTGVSFESGLHWSLAGFLALIVGGLGPYWAPLLGGCLLATLQTLSVYYLGPEWLEYSTFLVAIVFFVVRPQGIFQAKVRV